MISLSLVTLFNLVSISVTSFLNSGPDVLVSFILFVLAGDFACSLNWELFPCLLILLNFLSLYEFMRNSYLLCSLRGVFMWEHHSVNCVINMLDARHSFDKDMSHVFPQSVLATIP